MFGLSPVGRASRGDGREPWEFRRIRLGSHPSPERTRQMRTTERIKEVLDLPQQVAKTLTRVLAIALTALMVAALAILGVVAHAH